MSEVRDFSALINAADIKFAKDCGAFVALPDDHSIASLEHLQDRPNRARAALDFCETRSLAAYLDRFGTAATIINSHIGQKKITATIDFHAPGAPDHGEHTATFSAVHTERYKAWKAIHKKPMPQLSAGMFLEERALDVLAPDAATIMDLVMQFDALKKVTFKQSTRLHDGSRQFTYNEENEVRGNVVLPEKMTIRVAVFEGQEPEQISVRIKYRIEDGSLRFTFEIHEMVDVENHAFERCEDALLTAVKGDYLFLRSA